MMPGLRIAFDLPYALYLAPARPFTFSINGREVKIQLEDKRFTGETRWGKATNWELINDKAGTFRYTRIYIEYHGSTGSDQDAVVDFGHLAANRFIEVYRHVTGRAYLDPLRRHQIINPHIMIEQDDGLWAGTATIVFPKGAGPARPFDSEEIHGKVQKWLQESRAIQLHEILILNAQDGLEREDFRSSLVEAMSAVEVFVELHLRSVYKSWGWSDYQIARRLTSGRNWQITERLKKLLHEVTGRNISWNTEIWQPWHEGKKLRDKVVHSGLTLDYRNLEKVRSAVQASTKLIQHILELPLIPKPSAD